MTAVAWLFAAAALAVCGPSRAPARRGAAAERAAVPLRVLQLATCAAVGVGSVLVAGPLPGVVAAGVLMPGGWVLIARLHARPARARADPRLALGLDLVAVALRAGQPLAVALVLAAPPGPSGAALLRVAGLLRLGAAPDQAWAALADHPVLGPVAAAARRSAESGIRLAGAFERCAEQLRAATATAAQARARRVEVLVTAPLGLCFLPSFVCLGIVPTVVGVAGSVLGH